MRADLFHKFRDLVYRLSGIALSEQKEALVSMRIAKRLRHLRLKTEEDYFRYLSEPGNEGELVNFVDVITTNVTHFFRESEHFQVLGKEFERYKKEGRSGVRVWSAASSSGEEPYSIAMIASEVFAKTPVEVKILATDISTAILKKAVEGVYDAEKILRVPAPYLKKYFSKNGGQYEITEGLKSKVMFRKLNLNAPTLPLKGPIDVIFCRNVMIYFDRALKSRIVGNLFNLLKPGGLLFISQTESLAGISSRFKTVFPSVFRRPLENLEDSAHERHSDNP